MMYHAQKKHRANHNNYKQKPTKTAVRSQLKMYLDVNTLPLTSPISDDLFKEIKKDF